MGLRRCTAIFLLLLVACSGDGEVSTPEARPTRPQPLPRPTSADHVTLEPVTEEGLHRYRSVSAPAEVGVPYRYTLFTKCGLDHYVDFSGTLWKAVDEAGSFRKGPPPGFDEPRDLGTMTLVNQELAEYVSSEDVTVRFVRGPRQKLSKPCR